MLTKCVVRVFSVKGEFLMKKALLFLSLVLLVLLCGCERLCEWEVKEELQNNLVICSPVESEADDWYCTADTATKEVLSINLKFTSDCGSILATTCTVNGEEVEIQSSVAEIADGQVIFFTLENKYLGADCGDKIRIVQTFQNCEKEIYFSAEKIFEGIKQK